MIEYDLHYGDCHLIMNPKGYCDCRANVNIGLIIQQLKEQHMKNERTSKRVASIAGKVMRMLQSSAFSLKDECWGVKDDSLTFAELKALAASALTQTPDQKPAKKKGGRR